MELAGALRRDEVGEEGRDHTLRSTLLQLQNEPPLGPCAAEVDLPVCP